MHVCFSVKRRGWSQERRLLLLAVTLMVVAAAFDDCSLKNDNHFPYNTSFTGGKYVPVQVNSSYAKIPLIAILPTGQQHQNSRPRFHARKHRTLEMYLPNLRNYASHGFIVVFPYIVAKKRQKPADHKHKWRVLVMQLSLQNRLMEIPSRLYGQVDLGNIIVAGHSMGATCAISWQTLSNPENKLSTQHLSRGLSPNTQDLWAVWSSTVAQHMANV